MKKSRLKQIIQEEIQNVLGEMRVNPPGIGHLLNLDKSIENETKLVFYLSKYVDYPDLFDKDITLWETILWYDYDEALENIEKDDLDEMGFDQYSKEEWNKIHDDLNDNYNFNFFVRNWMIGDDEQTRHINDINQDIQYFKDKYDVNITRAHIMKKLIDDYLA